MRFYLVVTLVVLSQIAQAESFGFFKNIQSRFSRIFKPKPPPRPPHKVYRPPVRPIRFRKTVHPRLPPIRLARPLPIKIHKPVFRIRKPHPIRIPFRPHIRITKPPIMRPPFRFPPHIPTVRTTKKVPITTTTTTTTTPPTTTTTQPTTTTSQPTTAEDTSGPVEPILNPLCEQKKGNCISAKRCQRYKGNSLADRCSDSSLTCCVFDRKVDRKCRGRKGPCFARCQFTNEPCGTGEQGQYVKGLCSGPKNRQCCVPLGMKADPDTMTDKQARTALLEAGVIFRDRCKDRLYWRCISLQNIKMNCVKAMIMFKELVPNCTFKITGGTETGHACLPEDVGMRSHWDGYRLRFSAYRFDKCADKDKLLSMLKRVQSHNRDAHDRWEDAMGNHLYKDKKHWVLSCTNLMAAAAK